MFTRKDYLDGKCSHGEYYAQLVNESNAKGVVLSYFSLDDLKKMYESDKHFNRVPERLWLHHGMGADYGLYTWEQLGKRLVGVDWKKYGDYCSIAGQVCVLKEAARMIVLDTTSKPRNV